MNSSIILNVKVVLSIVLFFSFQDVKSTNLELLRVQPYICAFNISGKLLEWIRGQNCSSFTNPDESSISTQPSLRYRNLRMNNDFDKRL